jgi:hypothetical protein
MANPLNFLPSPGHLGSSGEEKTGVGAIRTSGLAKGFGPSQRLDGRHARPLQWPSSCAALTDVNLSAADALPLHYYS